MGQVFTWEKVESGKIPRKDSFSRTAAAVRATLVDQSAVVCALLFGSVVRGDFTVRSDIDCLVVYKTGQQDEAMETLQEIDRSAYALHVPLNFTPCDTQLARTRLHHIGTSFVHHLQASIEAGGLIKGDLASLLAPTISSQLEIESYIKMKMYSLQESLAQMATFSEERLASFLKKALEAPTHVARKMLIYEHVLDGDSKREVQERYREVMPPDVARQFDYLLELDRWYGTELENQLKQRNRDHYSLAIEHLQMEAPKVLDFLRSNILILDKAR